uniref:LD10453p (inferred by orthology to a D. melanogaster protein) n=1 Tax=Anisakis simplex TaxID=6269 RepID=A0A0M3JZ73_ANISI
LSQLKDFLVHSGTERERWRQFCTQYAKSVAFKFAESWRHYVLNSEHLGQTDVLASDVVQHFTNTLRDELLERLNASSLDLINSLPSAHLSQREQYLLDQQHYQNHTPTSITNKSSNSLNTSTTTIATTSSSTKNASSNGEMCQEAAVLDAIAANATKVKTILPLKCCSKVFSNRNSFSCDNESVNANASARWRSSNECEGVNNRAGSSQDAMNITRSRSEITSLATRPSSNTLQASFIYFSHRFKSKFDSRFAHHQPSSSLGISAPTPSTKRLSWFRSRFPAKTAVELIKESNVRYMSGLELETKHWRKCRLCLVKTAGGYLLEFYSPPKSNRAKSGIFCFLIAEARETTPLEFEDSNESIFAIRAFNGVEYVIEARNHEDCQQWLAVIRESIPGVELSLPEQRPPRQPSAPPIARTNFSNSRRFPSTRSLNNVHSMTSTFCVETHIPITMRAFPPGLEIYPWFHARLSRGVSARLVLHNGVDGHGLFLVRQSETRPGEFVLTFNCQGKAKHVRIVVMPDGECRIHQMIFDTMIDLLEHFRDNPIPLENSSHPPMFLNEYVICWRRRSMALTDIDVRDFLTYAGSVRLDIRALEQLVLREHENRQQRAFSFATSNNYHFY